MLCRGGDIDELTPKFCSELENAGTEKLSFSIIVLAFISAKNNCHKRPYFKWTAVGTLSNGMGNEYENSVLQNILLLQIISAKISNFFNVPRFKKRNPLSETICLGVTAYILYLNPVEICILIYV